MSNPTVILDSSALIAQINLNDLWHETANETAGFIARTDRQAILPSEVLAETLNRIGNNIGRQQAFLAGGSGSNKTDELSSEEVISITRRTLWLRSR